ncbi:MAG: MFS transporter [Lysobacterales bacterium]
MSTSTADDAISRMIDSGGISGQQILVVGLCMILNMVDGFDITAMAIVASAVSTELQLTPDKLGWVFSFALAGMMCGAMFLTPVSDMIGRRKMIVFAIALVGVAVVLTARATTLTEFVILRFLSGVGAGAMLASQATLAAEYSPEKYRSLSVALVTLGYPAGATMTSVVAGFIMPEWGWRGMFWFGGGVTLAMAVVAFLLIPESLKFVVQRRAHDALEKANKILAKMRKPAIAQLPPIEAESSTGIVSAMTGLLSKDLRGRTLTLWLTFFLCFSTLYFLMSWIPKLMEDSGFSVEVGRTAFFLFNLGAIVGIVLLGWLSVGIKLTNLVCSFLVASAVGMVVFALAPAEKNLLLTLIFVIGLLQQGGFTGLYSVAAKAYPTAVRSTGIGWAIGLGRLGAVFGPAVAGYLIVAGLGMSANFIVFAVPMAIGGLIAFRLHIR